MNGNFTSGWGIGSSGPMKPEVHSSGKNRALLDSAEQFLVDMVIKFTHRFTKKSRSEKVKFFFKKVATVPLFRNSCSLFGGSAAQKQKFSKSITY